MYHELQLTAAFNIAEAALAGPDAANMAGSASVTKQRNMEQNTMLCMDDELAGLIEAADAPADQHGARTTKPEPVSPVPGQLPAVQSKLLLQGLLIDCDLGLCCAVQ